MAGLFGPKPPTPLPVVNPGDTANRINSGMARMLQAGGTNADSVTGGSSGGSSGGSGSPSAPRLPMLTGLN